MIYCGEALHYSSSPRDNNSVQHCNVLQNKLKKIFPSLLEVLIKDHELATVKGLTQPQHLNVTQFAKKF